MAQANITIALQVLSSAHAAYIDTCDATDFLGKLRGHIISRVLLGASSCVYFTSTIVEAARTCLRLATATFLLFGDRKALLDARDGLIGVFGQGLITAITATGIVSPTICFELLFVQYPEEGADKTASGSMG
ncbi:MAG: hypothetical protein KDK78_07190 [Chlamydiia bacterium]|nr:hypothetical protein [Chlamydiia bacterium]